MGSLKPSGYSCVKYAFFTFNVVFWLLGCAVLAVGIWVHASNYTRITPSFNFLSATILLITVGAIILVVGFFGCCGAVLENQCMLFTYFLLVVVIFAMEVVAGILGFIYRNEIDKTVQKELEVGIKVKYPAPGAKDEDGLRKAWDTIQTQFHCCGVSNHTDWYNSHGWPQHKWVPDSCCKMVEPDCGHSEKPAQWHSQGCLGEMKYWLKRHLYIVGVVGITIGVVQVLAMVAALLLFCCLRNDKYYY